MPCKRISRIPIQDARLDLLCLKSGTELMKAFREPAREYHPAEAKDSTAQAFGHTKDTCEHEHDRRPECKDGSKTMRRGSTRKRLCGTRHQHPVNDDGLKAIEKVRSNGRARPICTDVWLRGLCSTRRPCRVRTACDWVTPFMDSDKTHMRAIHVLGTCENREVYWIVKTSVPGPYPKQRAGGDQAP